MPISIDRLDSFINHHVEGVKPPADHLIHYRQTIGAHHRLPVISSPGTVRLLEDALVFVCDRPNYFFLRVSLALRQKEIKTVLLTRWGVEEEQSAFFDEIVLYDRFADLKYLKQCRHCLPYVQSWVGWNFLPVYIEKAAHHPVFCNINDLTSTLLKDPCHSPLIGLSAEEMTLDMECEKYILQNLPVVTLPYVFRVFEEIPFPVSPQPAERLHFFPCYPCSDFFREATVPDGSGNHRFLFVGGIPPDHKPDAVFRDAKLHGVIDKLLKKQVHITILNNPQLSIGKQSTAQLYPHFNRLSCQRNNFSFRAGRLPWHLQKMEEPFHYGLMLYDFEDLLISSNHYRHIVPTKFFTYLEMGLPVIVSEEMTAVCEIVQNHGLGSVVSAGEIDSLDIMLAESDTIYNDLIENVKNYRRHYCIENIAEQVLVPLINRYLYF